MDHTSGSQSVDNLLDRFGCDWSQTKDSAQKYVCKSMPCKKSDDFGGVGQRRRNVASMSLYDYFIGSSGGGACGCEGR